jgi:hypothetical protein
MLLGNPFSAHPDSADFRAAYFAWIGRPLSSIPVLGKDLLEGFAKAAVAGFQGYWHDSPVT